MTRTLPLVGLWLLTFASCKKDGAVPAYVQLAPPVVVAANGQLVSSKITDAWVYVNDQPVGVWEPGDRIPLIAQGDATVKVIAGVRKNGIINDRIQYPFYATWQQQMDLVPEQTVVIQPQLQYFDNLDIWMADFETGQRFDTVDCTATMALVPSDSTLLGQGLGNGRINLDTDHPLYRGLSSGDAFTNTGPVAFLELDYRSDTPLLVGVRITVSGDPQLAGYIYAAPTKKSDGSMPWNKIYLDMATAWNIPGAQDKRFYIEASLPAGATSGIVEVDNIKLVRP